MRPWTIYLSGPISGDPDYREKFDRAERLLRSLIHRQNGIYIINPAVRHPIGLTDAEYARLSLAEIDACQDVCMLPGWESSAGASLEFWYANYIGKPVWQLEDRFPDWLGAQE